MYKNIEKARLFKDLSEGEIKTILEYFDKKDFDVRKKIISEGKSEQCLYILLKGKVEISKKLVFEVIEKRDKKLAILSGELKPVFGEIGLLGKNKRSATVKTLSKCELLKLTKKKFELMKKNDIQIAFKIMNNVANIIAERLKKTDINLVKMTTAFSIAVLQD